VFLIVQTILLMRSWAMRTERAAVAPEPRLGKSAALNLPCPGSWRNFGFLRRQRTLPPGASSTSRASFVDPQVGYVSERPLLRQRRGNPFCKSEGLYWKLETYLKKRSPCFLQSWR